ncbi:MAG TPA: hypothetical protein VM597_24455 [Gemmataceae bacterium]|jgi:hypothetical protein|nr:hypothetical protein [Gemmataceae bacterium]
MTRPLVLATLLVIPGLAAPAPALKKGPLDPKVRGQWEWVKIGKDPLVVFLEAVRKLAEAELEVAETPEAGEASLVEAVKQLKQAEAEMKDLQNAGLQTRQGVAQARAARLEAEIQPEKWKKR